MFRALLCSSSAGQIVLYRIWYRHTLVKSWFATLCMARGATLLVSPIRVGSSGLEHHSLYILMGEYGFVDALGLTFICVVGNIEMSDPRNTERVWCTA